MLSLRQHIAQVAIGSAYQHKRAAFVPVAGMLRWLAFDTVCVFFGVLSIARCVPMQYGVLSPVACSWHVSEVVRITRPCSVSGSVRTQVLAGSPAPCMWQDASLHDA